MMKKMLKLVILLLVPVWAVATDYESGTHYQVLDKPIGSNTDAIIVNEFFGYSCPHCYDFSSLLNSWSLQQAKDVRLVEVPVVFGRSWENYAKAYYISLQLGILDQTHEAMFNAVHVQKRRILTKTVLQKFFADQGVSEAVFGDAYDSFDLKNRLRQGNRLAARAKITGVPSMLVNGKYMVNATMAGSQEGMLAVVDFLIAKNKEQAN